MHSIEIMGMVDYGNGWLLLGRFSFLLDFFGCIIPLLYVHSFLHHEMAKWGGGEARGMMRMIFAEGKFNSRTGLFQWWLVRALLRWLNSS
jgi:hypothetical protein